MVTTVSLVLTKKNPKQQNSYHNFGKLVYIDMTCLCRKVPYFTIFKFNFTYAHHSHSFCDALHYLYHAIYYVKYNYIWQKLSQYQDL